MELSGIRVLIDGMNLQLSRGTGIKTYSKSLISCLLHLGINTSVLFGRNVASSKNPFLNESLFFDEQPPKERIQKVVKQYLRSLLSAYGFPWKANFVPDLNYVHKGHGDVSFASTVAEFPANFPIYNAPKCFDLSRKIVGLTKRPITITVPDHIDVFHMTSPMALKIKAAHTITTIHDLIPLKLPYTTLDRKHVFFRTAKHAINGADMIVTVSENSRKDILETFDIDPAKVVCTYQACSTYFSQQMPEEEVDLVLNRFELVSGNYILFTGAIEPKKNVKRLIDAFQHLDTNAPLVIVGPKAWLWKEELSLLEMNDNLKKRVRLLGHVPNHTLKALYHGARCFAFPSLYEGFGLPVLEAMSCGCPVLTSNTSSLPEICGPHAIYVDPYDITDITTKLETLLSDDDLCRQLSKAGRTQAEIFSHEAYASRLNDVYRKVLQIKPTTTRLSVKAA